MNSRMVSLLGSIFFMALTVGIFVWLWSTTNINNASLAVPENLKPVEIESVKAEAETLIQDLTNNAGLPIPVPTGKMGRENPFTGI